MKKKILWSVPVAVLVLAAIAFLLLWNGAILLNNPSREEYPIRGVDVSHYQGVINWQVLADQDIQFAFIKATEGSTYVDPRFAENWAQAQRSGLRVGAYHFFSFDTSGAAQAENFISRVKAWDTMLPPVVDLEFYGDKEKNPPRREAVRAQLNILLRRLEEFYGKKPILYVTEATYEMYIAGGYGDYDIWFRNVVAEPHLADGRAWTFWQYTNRETLPGYEGQERFIDMNVFYGDAEAFENYGK